MSAQFHHVIQSLAFLASRAAPIFRRLCSKLDQIGPQLGRRSQARFRNLFGLRELSLSFWAILILMPVNAIARISSLPPTIEIPDYGWKLWLDRSANWTKEAAFLPDEMPSGGVSKLPVHPPTGGWRSLNQAQGKIVTLPTTVEQHFWGVTGLRPYKGEYFYESTDKAPRNGNYLGVSWWYRSIPVPSSFAKKTAILSIRAAKQVAEVYVNQHLVGYQFIAETKFDCDVTKALRPGQNNEIAIRILNPGGRLDWGDWSSTSVGGKGIFAGHAFGGLDRGITLSAHDLVRISDGWVLNTPQERTVNAHATILNTGSASNGDLVVSVQDPKSGKILGSTRHHISIPADGNVIMEGPLTVPNANLWDSNHPTLYRMLFQWFGKTASGNRSSDERQTTFGFRWFGPTGVGENAMLKLNGNRIRVYSAISWGFYGINGLWPTPSSAEKEVRVAKSLGLNAINYHRNIARAESLDAADRMGLLRYTEPGGGMTLFWNKKNAGDSFQRYMQEKIVRMVRDHRSHPSLMLYVVQNELNDDSYKHPLAEIVIRKIHAEDPSRAAVLKSGLSSHGQMWMMPYDDKLYVDYGDGYSGWWDEHTVGTPDSWTDSNYTDFDHHVYFNSNKKEIIDYGEMGGSGAADNHALMVRQIQQAGGSSYDLLDHQEVDAAYNKFLDKFGFRKAFPTTDQLFRKIGEKQYDYWSHVLECARLSDETDYLTVSGWETTAVENHGGIVDVLRNPHGDPQVLKAALAPLTPVLLLRKSALVTGSKAIYDLAFINETNKPFTGQIQTLLRSPSGKETKLDPFIVPPYQESVFSYRVASTLVTPELTEPGAYTLEASVGTNTTKKIINVVKLDPLNLPGLAVFGASRDLLEDLAALGQPEVSYQVNQSHRVIVCSIEPDGTRTESAEPVTNTDDPELYRTQKYGRDGGMMFRIKGIPNGPVKVTLGFDEAYHNHPGERIFDMKVNGVTVIKDLDVVAQAGGKYRVWTKTVNAEVTNGTVLVEPGDVKIDNAMLSTLRIEAGGKVTALYFGDKPFTAKDGTVWKPYAAVAELPEEILQEVKERGAGLLIMATQDRDLDEYGKILDQAKVFHFDGLIGTSPAPWMGSWYIVRRHPLYEGLPQDTVMKSDYQVPVGQSNGILATGDDVQWATAFSRDHSRKIGAGDVIAKYGKGQILFHAVPRMTPPFQRRWLENAIRFLAN